MSLPLVSIIMPAYNAGAYIAEAIESIRQQTYTNWELLIADDCSTDDTQSVIKSYGDLRIHFHHNQNNLGYLKTCNKLFALCKGDYITFQDADDWSGPERIQKQLEAFQNNSNLGLCGTDVVVVDLAGRYIRRHRKPKSNAEIVQGLPFNNQFGGATCMVTRRVLEEIGGYRVFFDRKGSEDYDWVARICEKFEATNLPYDGYYYRQSPTSVSKTVRLDNYLSAAYVRAFIKERAENGVDSLETGNEQKIVEMQRSLEQPFLSDPSLIYRSFAATFMYAQLYQKALKCSLKAIRMMPYQLVNYRTLIYCLRKVIAAQV